MQVATIDALLAGVYDGHMTLRELRKHGDFGLGTFDRLDGEMILLDGIFYKARADGSVIEPPASETTPFATVTRFSPDSTRKLPRNLGNAALEKLIDQLVPDQNRFCAFRVDGVFQKMRVRSVPPQSEPYRPLVEVTKTQPIFEYANIRGTLVGFRSPAFVQGLNVPGYHIHFVSDDRSKGGHVLDLVVGEGTLSVDAKLEWLHVFLPSESRGFSGVDLSRDRTRELASVERE